MILSICTPPVVISIHAPRTGSDAVSESVDPNSAISIHAPRTGSDDRCGVCRWQDCTISIHAPRTGSDACYAVSGCTSVSNFNPRSPHGERPAGLESSDSISYFNPRSPHGERRPAIDNSAVVPNFNPRSPHGERQHMPGCNFWHILISIHAPRTGSDCPTFCENGAQLGISIHAPRTGSDIANKTNGGGGNVISIHAPRTGSDITETGAKYHSYDFNPRSPHGERPHRYSDM